MSAMSAIDALTGNPLILLGDFSSGNTGGDTILYNNNIPIPASIGGIVVGTVFTNKTMKEMWDMLLYPYQTPTFTLFVIQGQTTPLEVGNSILANRTFTWNTSNNDNIVPNTLVIRDITNAVDLAIGLANDGNETVTMGAITKNGATSHTFRISGTNTKAQNFQRDYSVNWQWRIYYGENILSSLTETDIKTLRISGLAEGFVGTHVFNPGGYKYLSYPTAYGSITAFKDQATNLDIPIESVYVVPMTNDFGITTNYNVYRTTNIIGSAINVIVS